MLNDVVIGQYFPGNSFIHKMDPRTKIIALTIFIFTVFLANDYLGYLILTIFTFLIAVASKVTMRMIFQALKPLWFR